MVTNFKLWMGLLLCLINQKVTPQITELPTLVNLLCNFTSKGHFYKNKFQEVMKKIRMF